MMISRETTRWVFSGLFVLAAHAGLAFSVMEGEPDDVTGDTSRAFVVELAALPIAQADTPDNLAPGPDQTEAAAMPEVLKGAEDEPKPETKLEEKPLDAQPQPAPEQDAEVMLPAQAPQKQDLAMASAYQAPAPTTSATQVEAAITGEKAAAPEMGETRIHNPISPAVWKSKLSVQLEKNKRYPAAARARQQRGEVKVAFVLDRQGRLLHSQLVRSSGHPPLDAEALELLARAQPFPPVPSEWVGERVSIATAIRFDLK